MQLADILVESAVVLPVAALVWLLYAKRLKKQGVGVPVAHTVWLMVFCVYLVGVLHITGTLSLLDILLGGVYIDPASISLIPMEGVTVHGFVLNVMMLVPLGLMMPLLFRGYGRFGKTLAAGFFTSLAIEIGQLFNWRATDVDDLIANTLGAVTGWLLFRLIVRRPPQKLQLSGEHAFPRMEAPIVIALMFVLVFLLKPLYAQLSMAFFDRILA